MLHMVHGLIVLELWLPWEYIVPIDLYSKTVLSCHSNIDKTKVLMINRSLMKVESIAECSCGAFCNTFDLH